MKASVRACALGVALLSTAGDVAIAGDLPTAKVGSTINIPDTYEVAGYTFSGLQLVPEIPALFCSVIGPPSTTATLNIWVFLYDSASATAPYAQIGGNALVRPGGPTPCNINNGNQSIPLKKPAKIDIQISTTATIFENKFIPVPEQR